MFLKSISSTNLQKKELMVDSPAPSSKHSNLDKIMKENAY
jgi:hypothetical protein